jgi:predicted nucleotidyltransferase
MEAVRDAARKKGLSFFVVGATARDMMLRYAYDLPVRRATRDVDVAIRAANWTDYSGLVNALVMSGEFTATEQGHRLLFQGVESLDIIPFGPIAGKERTIAWPPTEETVMGVLGFEEAFRSALTVRLRRDPVLDIPVATPAGLAVMKLISWAESYPARGKDAEDFYYIADNYLDAGNDDRLYNEAEDLTQVEVFNRALAGGRLLGRDMYHLAEDDARRKMHNILLSECESSGSLRLISDIIGSNLSLQEQFNNILALIRSVQVGLLDNAKRP